MFIFSIWDDNWRLRLRIFFLFRWKFMWWPISNLRMCCGWMIWGWVIWLNNFSFSFYTSCCCCCWVICLKFWRNIVWSPGLPKIWNFIICWGVVLCLKTGCVYYILRWGLWGLRWWLWGLRWGLWGFRWGLWGLRWNIREWTIKNNKEISEIGMLTLCIWRDDILNHSICGRSKCLGLWNWA